MAALASQRSPSAYATEVARAQIDIERLEAIAGRDARDAEKRVRLAYRQFHLASLTHHPEHFAAAEQTITDALRDFGPKEDLCLLKANIDGRFHRLDQVKEDLGMCPSLAQRSAGRAIQADIDFQEGRYENARSALEQLIAEESTWDNLARLAHWSGKFGDRALADRLYAEAEEQLTAKELRSFAWLELQRGELALSQGLFSEAHAHAKRAAVSFTGHWKNREFAAKILAEQGELGLAVAELMRVADSVSRPELHHAIGELLLALGRVAEAQHWLESALRDYLASARSGEVHYFHHLSDFYADAGAQPSEAVKWARRDVALRENFSTQSALAWALFRNGEIVDGLQWISRALLSGVQDAAVLSTAAALYGASGDAVQERQFQAAARLIYPQSRVVHLHL